MFFSVLCFDAFMRVCLLMPYGHLLGGADRLAFVCDVSYCEFVTFPLVSRVRCGT